MNSYNENLHAAVVGTLQNIDLEQQELKSQVNASMFTVYHAEGATIAAEQNLTAARNELKAKLARQSQAVKNSNLCINILGSATQANVDVKQSISNIAASAANVQLAANSIVRLASDMGSIFSIVNAADFDSDIYYQAEYATGLINKTAYDAEIASQLAMNASMSTAEVSATTVLDTATSANTLMSSILKITTTDFDAATQELSADNSALVTIRADEKADEGNLETLNVQYKASLSAYQLANKELNLDLRVEPSETIESSFTVEFDLIRSPFLLEEVAENSLLYPVKDYFLIVVKESKKQTFSISNAENLLLKNNGEMISVVVQTDLRINQFVNVYGSAENKFNTVKDSDDELIKPGLNYVVFVLAVFEDAYKRKINCYDDYLSAPSQAFSLTMKLEAAQDIEVVKYQEDKLSAEELTAVNFAKAAQVLKKTVDLENNAVVGEYTYQLNFNTTDRLGESVEYRCMLLPFTLDVADDLLTGDSLEFLTQIEIKDLEQISNEFDPKIAELQASNYEYALNIQSLEQELKDLSNDLEALTKLGTASTEDDKAKEQSLQTEHDSTVAQLKAILKSEAENNKSLKIIIREKKEKIDSLTEAREVKPGFLFNLPIAEQVFADSYTVAIKLGDAATEGASWVAFIGPETTDNFGNRLIKNERYLPVVLSYSTAAEENVSDVVNVLSAIETTNYFEY